MSNSKIVYHYTSLATFQQIIHSNTLWATETSMLNDPHENSFFVRNRTRINNIFESNNFHHYDDYLIDEASLITYSVSASADSDNVAMWRDYADAGRGVAIGIDTSVALKTLTRLEDPIIQFTHEGRTRTVGRLPALQIEGWLPINYEDEHVLTNLKYVLQEQASKTLDARLFATEDTYEEARQEFQDGIHAEVTNQLKTANLTTKKPGWRYESEWRHVVHESPHFGNSRAAFIHKTDFGLARKLRLVHGDSSAVDWNDKNTECTTLLPIRSVVLGPNTSTPCSLIRQILIERGYSDVEVSASDSQFR